MKIFKRSIWCMLTAFFAIMLAVVMVGDVVAKQYSTQINGLFDINPYEIVDEENEDVDTEYYKSNYYSEDGTYDNQSMRKNSMDVSLQAANESGVLLWNENNCLPLKKNSQVNLFGNSSVNYILCENGSGYITPLVTETMKSQLEKNGVTVNTKLYNAYKILKSKGFVRSMIRTTGMGLDSINDSCYNEMSINEAGWNDLNSTTLGNVTDSLYNDTAVMVISRVTGEDQDSYKFVTQEAQKDECFDNNYMDLSKNEADILSNLQELKRQNKIKRIVLLINSSNTMQFKNIKNYDIDACMWTGVAGNVSYNQIAELLTGKVNPSGHLTDTYVYDSFSAPSTQNFGDFSFTFKSSAVPKDGNYTHNDKYVVYQEGIYVGYRYYETRYEDSVLQQGNASASNGAKITSDEWNYKSEVAFPFGYGLSYSNFEYSNYTVIPKGDTYEVSMKIKNLGDYSGKEVMQVYLQKPYTTYDKENNIEKSSVELVGFAKTKELGVGDSEKITVTVKKEDFKTYDAYGKGTYILEKGDYYLAVGKNSHDALNNILAAKGKNIENKMDQDGDSSFSKKITIENDDYIKYSVSPITNNTISNQFENADINLYEGTSTQKIKYLSRNNWNTTYPSAVLLACSTQVMSKDMNYGEEITDSDEVEMPSFGKTSEKYGKLTLTMLKDIPYENEYWDALLDQLTWADANKLVSGPNDGAVSISAPGMKTKDGPFGIGIAAENLDSCMCFPCEVNLSSTWNIDLIEKVGEAFGLEILHLGYTGIYGPGANIHRSSSFSGRNAEYYSEDGFISGKMLSAECQGIQKSGVIVFSKHFLLNDQERNRYGITVWANEQSIREIYLKAFEAGVTEGKMNGIMSSFNRIGCTWAGRHEGLLTEVLRNEWGFTGVNLTDAAVCTHFHMNNARGCAILAGQDVWMGGSEENFLNDYRNNALVCQALRQACHRILYNRLNSNAINGMTATAKIVKVSTWWEMSLQGAEIGIGSIFGICVVMTILSFVFATKKYRNDKESSYEKN